MDSGKRWRLGHRPGLDGLRGVAVLLVVACHVAPQQLATGGRVGVSAFFALSGFLITSLLLEGGTRDLGAFYLRRARRLLPAVLVFLAVMVGLAALAGPWLATPRELVPPLLYLQNVAVINGVPTGGLTHLWSLSVEEQFYFAWPLALLLLLRSRRLLVGALVAGIVVSVGLRVWLLASGAGAERIYMAPDSGACLLLVGCLLAVVMHQRQMNVSRGTAWAALLALIALSVVPNGRVVLTVVPVAAAVLSVVLIAGLCTAGPLRPPSWLALVGRRSYALYLWHYPLVAIIPAHLPVSRWVSVPVMLLLSWGAATASWHLVEQPMLRRRSGDLLDEELSRVGGRRRRLAAA